MITKQAIIEDDLAEIEKILEEYWITEEDRFRSILNELDEAKVWEMIKFLRIFEEPESREDKLRRMWTRIYEADQHRKQDGVNPQTGTRLDV